MVTQNNIVLLTRAEPEDGPEVNQYRGPTIVYTYIIVVRAMKCCIYIVYTFHGAGHTSTIVNIIIQPFKLSHRIA